MDFVRLEIVKGGGGAECVEEQFDRAKATFFLDEDIWNEILRISNLCGAFTELKEGIEVVCGICGNFIVPVKSFLNSLSEGKKPYSDRGGV